MYQSVNFYEFRDAFKRMGRNENFSHEGLGVLFDYLEELEEDMGTPIELDVIALCCDYYEQSINDIASSYDIDLSDCEDDDDRVQTVREYLEENTAVCGEVAGGFVFQCF